MPDPLERIAIAMEALLNAVLLDNAFHQKRTAEMIAEVRALNEQVERGEMDYDPGDEWKKGDHLDD